MTRWSTATAPTTRGTSDHDASHDTDRRQVSPVTGRYDSVSDATPTRTASTAHQTYAKGEVSSIGELISDITADLSRRCAKRWFLARPRPACRSAGQARSRDARGPVWPASRCSSSRSPSGWALGSWVGQPRLGGRRRRRSLGRHRGHPRATGRNQLKHVKGMPRTVETAKKVPDRSKRGPVSGSNGRTSCARRSSAPGPT